MMSCFRDSRVLRGRARPGGELKHGRKPQHHLVPDSTRPLRESPGLGVIIPKTYHSTSRRRGIIAGGVSSPDALNRERPLRRVQ